MSSLILLRHGTTALNAQHSGESTERIRGHVDVPLDKAGQREATALAAKYANAGLSKIYTTDLQRGKDVAVAIARAAHVPIVETDELRPWDLGYLQGKEVKKVLPLMNKCVEHPDVIVPDGESFDQFRKRYLPLLSRLLKEAATSKGNVLAVTHSRNVQLARAWDKAGRPDDFTFDVGRMLDYRDEVAPGKSIELKP